MSDAITPDSPRPKVGLDPICLLPHAIAHWAAETPDNPAVTYVDGPTMTYADLDRHVRRWAAAYRRIGIGPRDHVATMIPNGFTVYGAWVGLGWLKAIEVPLNGALVGPMLRYMLDNSDSTTLVMSAQYVERLHPIAHELPTLQRLIVVDGEADTDGLPFEVITEAELLADVEPADDLEGPLYRDIACILYTSGTTGPSKGVLTTWATIYQMWSWVPPDAILPGEAAHMSLPMFHNSGKSGITSVISRGGHYVMRDRFSATSFWEEVRRYDCKIASVVGPMLALINSAPRRDDDADNPLRSVVCGPMIPEVEDFKERFGVKVGTCYGMTETGAPVATTWDHGPWAGCGRLREDYPWTRVRLVDDNDEPVAIGEIGEMIVNTEEPWALNAGYYNMPEKTAEAWRNGWFHTGDAFRQDEDGWYYFVDRMKDTIRRRGENISSFEVEAIIGEFPPVSEVAAYAVPDGLGGDEVMVAIIPMQGETVDPAELAEWLQPRMPKYMIPRYVDIVEEFPRNETTMRVKKHELRAAGITASAWDREAAG
ncbi:MAG: AMP-binding protein [Acidimicrobiales bacterium]|nr:AMP-binding protein [Acidimicrobiales bacterium]